MSRGMIPIMPNMDPQNSFLCNNNMFDVAFKKIKTRTEIDCAVIELMRLANAIDILANKEPKELRTLSVFSDLYTNTISWEILLPEYLRIFENLCTKEQSV